MRCDDKKLFGHDLDARFDTTHASSPRCYMGVNSRLKALYTSLTSPKTTGDLRHDPRWEESQKANRCPGLRLLPRLAALNGLIHPSAWKERATKFVCDFVSGLWLRSRLHADGGHPPWSFATICCTGG